MMASLQEALQRRRDKELGSIWASDVSLKSDGSIYLGSGQDASNLEQLILHNVYHILNVADDVPNFHETKEPKELRNKVNVADSTCALSSHRIITYCNLSVGDFGADVGISRVFNDAIQFVEECLASNKSVLVHCANGSNRSSTVVIAVFMAIYGMPLKEAFTHVKSKHRATNPLKDNRAELMKWEKQISRKLSTQGNTVADSYVVSTMKEADFDVR